MLNRKFNIIVAIQRENKKQIDQGITVITPLGIEYWIFLFRLTGHKMLVPVWDTLIKGLLDGKKVSERAFSHMHNHIGCCLTLNIVRGITNVWLLYCGTE